MFRSAVYFMIAMGVFAGCKQQSQQAETEKPMPETTTVTENKAPQTNRAIEEKNVSEDEAAAVPEGITVAICELEPIGDSGVAGTIHFTKEGDSIQMKGEVNGLTQGKHGFHVHENGDLSDKETGKSAGGHFNPTNQPHGRPTDKQRHVGDLGNIEAGDNGEAMVDMEDNVIKLNGDNSIVGHAIVVHAGEDKFTQPSGDAGDRVAFGVIESSK